MVFKNEKHQSRIFVSNSFIPFYSAHYSNPLVDLKFRDPAKSKSNIKIHHEGSALTSLK